MKKITWKKSPGGRAFENLLEGWVDKEVAFRIEGRLCLTDLREMNSSKEFVSPKHYRLSSVNDSTNEAKTMAHELLNNINLEKHQLIWQNWVDEQARSARALRDADEFLEKLKNGLI